LSALTDVIQDAAKRHHASFPTTGVRRRFIETSRKALAFYAPFKKLPARTRNALKAGPIETDAQEEEIIRYLLVMMLGVTKQLQSEAKPSPQRLKLRGRMASLILKGIAPDISKDALTVIERDLLKLYAATTAAEASEQNKENRKPTADDADLQKRVRGIVSALKNKALSKNDRARYVLQRLSPHDRIGPRGQTWTTNALIKWARKRRLPL
jgi:hypothetical protein